jgi:hypothetical protein
MRRRSLLLVLIALLSCAPNPLNHYVLDSRWYPLQWIQRADWVEPDVVRTSIPILYTRSIEDFLAQPDIERNALLLHEQHHAQKQLEYGLNYFNYLYTNDYGFRANEERAGWSLQIRYIIHKGGTVDPYSVATFMSTHYGGVFEFQSTLAWVANEITLAYSGQ